MLPSESSPELSSEGCSIIPPELLTIPEVVSPASVIPKPSTSSSQRLDVRPDPSSTLTLLPLKYDAERDLEDA